MPKKRKIESFLIDEGTRSAKKMVDFRTGKPCDPSDPEAIHFSTYRNRQLVHSQTGKPCDPSDPQAVSYSTYYSRRLVNSQTGQPCDLFDPNAIRYSNYCNRQYRANKKLKEEASLAAQLLLQLQSQQSQSLQLLCLNQFNAPFNQPIQPLAANPESVAVQEFSLANHSEQDFTAQRDSFNSPLLSNSLFNTRSQAILSEEDSPNFYQDQTEFLAQENLPKTRLESS